MRPALLPGMRYLALWGKGQRFARNIERDAVRDASSAKQVSWMIATVRPSNKRCHVT